MKTFIRHWLLPPGALDLLTAGRNVLKRSLRNYEERSLLDGNKALQNRHMGQRCFILGSGSSINRQNLALLEGECVISVSNSFVHPDFQRIRPIYHVLPTMLYGHGGLHSEKNFVGWLREMEGATNDSEMFFHIGDRKMIAKARVFQNRRLHWVDYEEWDGTTQFSLDLSRIPHINSVSELAITIALYLGFDDIYLLGIDHDWFNGLFVYFYDHTQQHAMRPDKSKLSSVGVDAEFQMRRHADIFRKYKYLYRMRRNIFNANADPAHYMDVFPKVKFEDLFEDKHTGRPENDLV